VKIAIVVQRYGADINGGAELHARYIAEHLSTHVGVEVLTTCASDYITWRNALPAGVETVRGVAVRRFPVSRERDPAEFGRMSDRVFGEPHSLRDELAWLDAEGPTSPQLIDYITQHADAFDFFIFFSCRYYHAYHGARAVPSKAILVPTAERDGALGLSMFGPIFRGVRALMYNSYEERALIQTVSNNHDIPGVVVGVGSEIPAESRPDRFRQKYKLEDRFAIYIGRIDENKGCHELFAFFQRYARLVPNGVHLVLIGNAVIPSPDHPRIHHLGFVNDQDKFDALAASSLLIMPSYFESLSMVAIEAWALGKPVLANGRCDVLKGQCIRSNGGLYYDNFQEFIETLHSIDTLPTLSAGLGRSGREYFNTHYTWPVVERKYLDMLDQLSRHQPAGSMAGLPWWFVRRREDLPPADDVVGKLPTGPSLDGRAKPEASAIREAARPRNTEPPRRHPAPPNAPVPGRAASAPSSRSQPATTLNASSERPRQQRPPGSGPSGGDRRQPAGNGGFRGRSGRRPPRRNGGR
jgi:glycosyltransferase involved in cell wall biosynthesis